MPKRRATPAPSTHSPTACCRCALARPPSFRPTCSMPTSTIARCCNSVSPPPPAIRKARFSPPARSVQPRRNRGRAAALHGRNRANSAHAFGAQASGAPALRIRPRRHRNRATAAPGADSRPRTGRMRSAPRGAGRAMQRWHLYPHPGAGHRRGARLRRPPHRTDAQLARADSGWNRHTRLPIWKHLTPASATPCCFRQTAWWRICPLYNSMTPTPRPYARAAALRTNGTRLLAPIRHRTLSSVWPMPMPAACCRTGWSPPNRLELSPPFRVKFAVSQNVSRSAAGHAI